MTVFKNDLLRAAVKRADVAERHLKSVRVVLVTREAEIAILKANIPNATLKHDAVVAGNLIECWRERAECAEAEFAELKKALTDYLGEYDAPVPDYGLRNLYRNKLRTFAAPPQEDDPK
jgi:hypothetical protein